MLEDVKTILRERLPDIEEIRAEEIVIGLGYTGVKLDNGVTGVCHTLSSEFYPGSCQVLDEAGEIAGRRASDLLDFTESWDIVKRVISVATINALSSSLLNLNQEGYLVEERNLIDVLQVNSDEIVVMVGLITPFRKVFESKAKGLYILERGMSRNMNVYPDTASEDIIPKSDIVVITGSSMANGTIDRLLDLSENAKTKAMVGPTASCIPDPLFDRGVDYVGGIRILNSDLALRIIMEGGGTRQLRKSGKFVTYKRA